MLGRVFAILHFHIKALKNKRTRLLKCIGPLLVSPNSKVLSLQLKSKLLFAKRVLKSMKVAIVAGSV